ncbi:hypothetical protein V495_03620 [Pseudogymnoascus sp. VKM F-4514 (FW-929)]|nr:hypothetical protein V495_03620 [Pseudogymnoascus sp. VKM F-4514 (FW-929)]
MQADNGKEFKGALLLLLRKYGIQVVNRAPQSPQTQGLVEQANGAQPELEPELGIELSGSEFNSEPEIGLELNSELRTRAGTRAKARARAQLQKEPELGIELRAQVRTRARAPARAQLGTEAEPGIELERSKLNSELRALARTRAKIQARAQARAQVRAELQLELELELQPEPGIELSGSELNSELWPSSGSRARSSSEPELNSELRRGTRARVPAQLRTELQATPDPVIERAIVATQRARISMVRKYTKKHDIQHFDIGAIVSIKVPREDRTSTDNKRLFAQILEEPYPYRYQILTASSIIQCLIPTKSLGVVEQALWGDIVIPTSTKKVSLRIAAREASTSAQVGISC